jgi:SHS2 domain-containing protein
MTMVSRRLRVHELWVGPDFALGRNREGSVERLRELGQALGYDLRVVEPVGDAGGGQAFSSSRIRELLARGRMEEAALQLGRYFSLSGEVVTGARRGRKLGFPTANLEVRPERALPADGVYAVFAVLGTEHYPGVANVGVRPSFENGNRMVETHVLDFDQDIYGCDLVVEFVSRLRDELRFERIDDLIAQIERDSEAARQILASRSSSLITEGDVPNHWEEAGPPGCPYRYLEVEHTADRALQVWGRQLPDLFVGAARGMTGLMADLDSLAAIELREVRLEGWDRESLLVNWLNELLFLAETERLLFVNYQFESLTDTALVARVRGAHAPVTKAAIKAATYHALRLVRDHAGWSTVITFDV